MAKELNTKKVAAIVQARMGSSRFPGKVLKSITGIPVIGIILARLKRCSRLDMIILATGKSCENDDLARYAETQNVKVVRGDDEDVLSRFAEAAETAGAGIVVRITGDCPLVEPVLVDEAVDKLLEGDLDYVANINPPTFPDGLDVEAMTVNALADAAIYGTSDRCREHVTTYIRESDRFAKYNITNDVDLSDKRWTLDTKADFVVLTAVFESFPDPISISMLDVLKLEEENPELFRANRDILRNSGEAMSKGQKVWGRAKKVIPGGVSLLSKRPDLHHPTLWPTYFDKAKGIQVWDLDGRSYTDVSLMGVGTNILGYSNELVDRAVVDAIAKGTVSTLNCAEEVLLAEKLVELHSWAEMVRFARTGGEACAIAVRIARAAAGKNKIAFCGYHGWHDWYLASNLAKGSNLDGQLLPGLEPRGVPKELVETAQPFFYNDYQSFLNIVEKNKDIGVVIMEPMRNAPPRGGFLEKIRKYTQDNGIVLVFDEITSGFRKTVGGLHLHFEVEPDVAVFGKAMGNGFPISAVIGRRSVMEAAQSTFISSTYWTERIGPVAALKTIEIFQKEKIPQQLDAGGEYLRKKWEQAFRSVDLRFSISGIPALSHFSFAGIDMIAAKTYICEKMLNNGYLAGTSAYLSVLHTNAVVDAYVCALEHVLAGLKEASENGGIAGQIKGPVCSSGFKRVN